MMPIASGPWYRTSDKLQLAHHYQIACLTKSLSFYIIGSYVMKMGFQFWLAHKTPWILFKRKMRSRELNFSKCGPLMLVLGMFIRTTYLQFEPDFQQIMIKIVLHGDFNATKLWTNNWVTFTKSIRVRQISISYNTMQIYAEQYLPQNVHIKGHIRTYDDSAIRFTLALFWLT